MDPSSNAQNRHFPLSYFRIEITLMRENIISGNRPAASHVFGRLMSSCDMILAWHVGVVGARRLIEPRISIRRPTYPYILRRTLRYME